jgi:hypothetical protein
MRTRVGLSTSQLCGANVRAISSLQKTLPLSRIQWNNVERNGIGTWTRRNIEFAPPLLPPTTTTDHTHITQDAAAAAAGDRVNDTETGADFKISITDIYQTLSPTQSR